MEDKKVVKEARTIFNSLETDPNSTLFSQAKNKQQIVEKTKKIEIFKRLSDAKTYKFS